MEEINWGKFAIDHELTVSQFEDIIFKLASVMGDMNIADKEGAEFGFICEHERYKTRLTVERVGK